VPGACGFRLNNSAVHVRSALILLLYRSSLKPQVPETGHPAPARMERAA
jgi:hypothetical protein